jgi:hypothetical protein
VMFLQKITFLLSRTVPQKLTIDRKVKKYRHVSPPNLFAGGTKSRKSALLLSYTCEEEERGVFFFVTDKGLILGYRGSRHFIVGRFTLYHSAGDLEWSEPIFSGGDGLTNNRAQSFVPLFP